MAIKPLPRLILICAAVGAAGYLGLTLLPSKLNTSTQVDSPPTLQQPAIQQTKTEAAPQLEKPLPVVVPNQQDAPTIEVKQQPNAGLDNLLNRGNQKGSK